MPYYVYMLASKKGGTIYTGMTRDLERRIYEHRDGTGSKFTAKYNVKRLVWFEQHDRAIDAIQREKNIKQYLRRWKVELNEASNPEWHDLSKMF